MHVRRFRASRRNAAQQAASRTRLPAALRGGAPERSLFYRVREDGWWLWCPCAACGGVELPLRAQPAAADLAAGVFRLEPAVDARTCPGCETRQNRSAASRTRPCVWYDTVLRDWVVQLPWTGRGGGAILPLEIRWFDAPLAAVYRAAGDLAFSGDAFDQSDGD